MLQGLHWPVTGDYMSNLSQKQHFTFHFQNLLNNIYSKSPWTQQLTVMQQWEERLATVPDGKLPTNHKTEG